MPERKTVNTATISELWFDEACIFYSVAPKNAIVTKESLQGTFNFIKEHAGNNMICWIGDVSNVSFSTKEARDFAGTETPKFVKALALVVNSELSKLLANVFLALKRPPYPTKMFTNREDAKIWIKLFL